MRQGMVVDSYLIAVEWRIQEDMMNSKPLQASTNR